MVSLDKIIKNVDTFVFDVDGVFTDCRITVSNKGISSRTYNSRDGFALQLALKKGYTVWIISGGQGESIMKRFEPFRVQEIITGPTTPKLQSLSRLMQKYNVTKDRLCYMGDDIPDLEAIQLCELRTCPKNACDEIRKVANFVSTRNGGDGCIREVIEKVLKTQRKWIN